jgi:hypothetical protein
MPAVAWFTVAVSAVIVAFIAVGLLRVIFHLRAIRATLGQVLGGSAVIAEQTSTVPQVVDSVNASLKPVRDFADSI